MGGCDDATAGVLCCPTQTCADGSVEQAFGDGMIGCAGKVTFDQRAALCPTGSYVCTAAQWVAKRGGQIPSHHYWTNDALKYSGTPSSCSVSVTSGSDCGASTPMRVCLPDAAGTSIDPEGNACNWSGCGLGQPTPAEHFGGCSGNTTAGALCCRNQN